jgi:hypothetical protein
MAISGSLADGVTPRTGALDFQTTSGSSILPPTNGPGWAATKLSAAVFPSTEHTAIWESLLLETSPVGDGRKRHGRMLMVIFGSLEDKDTLQVV